MQDLVHSLHPLERKVIPFLKSSILFEELVEKTKLQEAECIRAVQWLENKEVLKIKTDIKEEIILGSLGKKYLQEKLPERRLLEQLKQDTDGNSCDIYLFTSVSANSCIEFCPQDP